MVGHLRLRLGLGFRVLLSIEGREGIGVGIDRCFRARGLEVSS